MFNGEGENASDFDGGRFFAAGEGVRLGDFLSDFKRLSVSLDLDCGIVGGI